MTRPKLGINIDHVATLRQARGEMYPSVVDAAKSAIDSGADQITVHLREDRRHIQDTDVSAVKLVVDQFNKPLNFEMGCNQEILDVAISLSPQWICLVPEKREEKTTEGGLDLDGETTFEKVKQTMETIREKTSQDKSFSLFRGESFCFRKGERVRGSCC